MTRSSFTTSIALSSIWFIFVDWWITKLTHNLLAISNRPWCPFVRLTIFMVLRDHRKRFHRHMRRDWRGWISKSCGCPPGLTKVSITPWYPTPMSNGIPPMSTTMIRAKHAIRLSPVCLTQVDHHDMREEIAIWKINQKLFIFFLRGRILKLYDSEVRNH